MDELAELYNFTQDQNDILHELLSDEMRPTLLALCGGIGIIGVMSVAAVCVTPYLQLAVHYALYKLAAGIAESFADKRVGRLIGGFADVYGFLLGMVGVASLILFLSIVSSMKAVTG